jgi:two-component system, OmpR family, sensor kinase
VSIFQKITILFVISIFLMSILSFWTNEILTQNIETLQQSRYTQASQVLFDSLVKGDTAALDSKAKEFGYVKLESKRSSDVNIVYSTKTSFGAVNIYEDEGIYYLDMRYLDDEVVFFDRSQTENIWQKGFLNFFLIADIIILILMFVIILGILRPLRSISRGIEKFGSGDYKYRLESFNKSSDEISKLKTQFNTMAQNIETLITSREQFMADISHELRTPIAQAKLSLEMIEHSRYKQSLTKSIEQIDILTHELLGIERLRSGNFELKKQKISISQVLIETLSRIFADEDEITIEQEETFEIYADIDYLSMAIKNLIDNALKYKTHGAVYIAVKKNVLEIRNFSPPLSKELTYYIQPFTREEQQSVAGYGLGLNIVSRILSYHGFRLGYDYRDGQSVFIINF